MTKVGRKSWVSSVVLGGALLGGGSVAQQPGAQEGAERGENVEVRTEVKRAQSPLRLPGRATTPRNGRPGTGPFVGGAIQSQPGPVEPMLEVMPPSGPLGHQDVFRLITSGAAPDALNFKIAGLLNDDGAGATLEPADESLRAQLSLPEGQGLVVAAVAADGPASRVGLVPNDVLLTLADRPLGKPDDLPKQLKAAGDNPVNLRLLRGGKPLTIQVRPRYRVTLGPVEMDRSQYVLGVRVNPPEPALREQLSLPANQGLVVSAVEPGSPAEKAGLKKHDVLLTFGEKPLTDPESLVTQLRETDGKPAKVEFLRGGKRQSAEVTAEKRDTRAEAGAEAWYRGPVYTVVRPRGGLTPGQPNLQAPAWALPGAVRPPAEAQLEDLAREIRKLHEAVESLRQRMEAQLPSPKGEK